VTNEFHEQSRFGYRLVAMPSLSERLPQNVPGHFYVDASCIDCDLCRNTAPEFFRRDDEIGFSFVHRQPVTPAEIALAEEARDACPSESIGSDA
jgi:ferredoxin